MGQGRLSDAELIALGAVVQADAVDAETHNRRMASMEMNRDHHNLRFLSESESYKRLVEEIRERGIL